MGKMSLPLAGEPYQARKNDRQCQKTGVKLRKRGLKMTKKGRAGAGFAHPLRAFCTFLKSPQNVNQGKTNTVDKPILPDLTFDPQTVGSYLHRLLRLRRFKRAAHEVSENREITKTRKHETDGEPG